MVLESKNTLFSHLNYLHGGYAVTDKIAASQSDAADMHVIMHTNELPNKQAAHLFV